MSKFLAGQWNQATDEMNSFFAEMDAKIKTAQDNEMDEQIWTTPNQRRLIAAAPELLQALRDILDMVTDNRLHGPEVLAAANAIAKAQG